jgi:DNA anti-recombination protein RmuC
METRTMSNAERSEQSPEIPDTAEFEGEIRELIRSRDVTFLRSPAKSGGDLNNLNSLIQRAAGDSSGEIDSLIMQLQDMRDYLQDEAERIRDEIAKYVQVSQAIREHAEALSDRMAQWRPGIESPPTALSHD